MKKITILFILSFLLCSCSSKEEVKIKVVPCNKIEELINNNAILIDVRTKEEYETDHLPTAVNIPYTDIASKIQEISEDKEDPIIVYCQSGTRSNIAAHTLIDDGYTNVYDYGSINNCKDLTIKNS